MRAQTLGGKPGEPPSRPRLAGRRVTAVTGARRSEPGDQVPDAGHSARIPLWKSHQQSCGREIYSLQRCFLVTSAVSESVASEVLCRSNAGSQGRSFLSWDKF